MRRSTAGPSRTRGATRRAAEKRKPGLRELYGELDEPLQLLLHQLLCGIRRQADQDVPGREVPPDPPVAGDTDTPVVARAEWEDGTTYVVLRLRAQGIERLTEREKEIVRLVGRGLQNQEIAARLGVRRSTVAAHLRRIFPKLGATTRQELLPASLILMS